MKIVNRDAFLALPSGTVYSLYEPHIFNGLCIKADTIGSAPYQDFGTYDLASPFLDAGDDDSLSPKILSMPETGDSYPVDFTMFGRYGSYEPDQLFAIWEADDVRGMIELLGQALI